MEEVKKDYVILVGGGLSPRWLAHNSIETDGAPSKYPETTTDPEMAFRTAVFSEARSLLRETVKSFPSSEFRIDVADPLPPKQALAPDAQPRQPMMRVENTDKGWTVVNDLNEVRLYTQDGAPMYLATREEVVDQCTANGMYQAKAGNPGGWPEGTLLEFSVEMPSERPRG